MTRAARRELERGLAWASEDLRQRKAARTLRRSRQARERYERILARLPDPRVIAAILGVYAGRAA